MARSSLVVGVICRFLPELLPGRGIEVSSRPGEGTKVMVKVPRGALLELFDYDIALTYRVTTPWVLSKMCSFL